MAGGTVAEKLGRKRGLFLSQVRAAAKKFFFMVCFIKEDGGDKCRAIKGKGDFKKKNPTAIKLKGRGKVEA